jgi:hypothetical protein
MSKYLEPEIPASGDRSGMAELRPFKRKEEST